MGIVQTGGQSQLLTAGSHGVLLIHGFTGSPSEMSLLAKHLHNKDYTVYSVRLPGHSTTVEDLACTNYRHWISAVEDAYYSLDNMCDRVSVVGMSMGGLLALNLAHDFPIHKAVSLATPIHIKDKRLPFIALYGLFNKYVDKKERVYDLDVHIRYNKMPVSSVGEMVKLIKHVKPLLPAIQTPCLVMQSAVEHTLQPDSAEYIHNNLGSKDKQLVWKYHSGHLLVLDKEREIVFQDIAEFLEGDADG